MEPEKTQPPAPDTNPETGSRRITFNKADPSAAPEPSGETGSRRITFKKTETSRLKSVGEEGGKAAPPAALPTTAKPAGGRAPERTAVVDPMALRDTHTSKVKRVQAVRDSGPLATTVPGEPGDGRKTETVQLKVVQQKKKEIADMMSPASTVRLRAPVPPGQAAAPEIEVPRPRPVATARETLKIPVPAGDGAAAPGPAGTAAAPPAEDRKTSTRPIQKLRVPPPAPEEKAAAVKTVPVVVPPAAGATPDSVEEAEGEAGAKARHTLKLRGGAKTSKTIKVQAGGRKETGGTVAVPPEAQGEAADTVKVEEPAGERKLMKLKGKAARELGTAPVVARTMPRPQVSREEPGVGFTLAAAASLLAMAALTYFLVVQVMAHVL